jgi:cell wall-associated NlpC family hydrolase
MNLGAAALRIARAQIGKRYVYGTAGPDTFDCSGLVWFAYAHAGLVFPRMPTTGLAMMPGMVDVPLDKLQPGDLIFYGDPIHHVAISQGGTRVVHAPHTGSAVSEASLSGPGKPVRARRFSAVRAAEEGGGVLFALTLLVGGLWLLRRKGYLG